jgi:hypothetical protein
MYAGTPEISGMRAKSALVWGEAKHLFSVTSDHWLIIAVKAG